MLGGGAGYRGAYPLVLLGVSRFELLQNLKQYLARCRCLCGVGRRCHVSALRLCSRWLSLVYKALTVSLWVLVALPEPEWVRTGGLSHAQPFMYAVTLAVCVIGLVALANRKRPCSRRVLYSCDGFPVSSHTITASRPYQSRSCMPLSRHANPTPSDGRLTPMISRELYCGSYRLFTGGVVLP